MADPLDRRRAVRRYRLAGRLAEQTLASAALPATGAAFALAVLLAAHRQLRPTGQLPRGRHRRPFRGRHKTP